jgi:hypothetical protein
MTFTCDDLAELTGVVADAWRAGADRDWSARAGSLTWSCARTADHTADTVLAPAIFLASRKQDGYPDFGVATAGPAARPEALIEALETASRILVAVVMAAPPGARAVIWRRPLEVRGPEDFPPRAGLELILHGHDVCRGLGVAYAPPRPLCDRLRRHTAGWPHWRSRGWSRPTLTDDPWSDLLQSSGRRPVS